MKLDDFLKCKKVKCVKAHYNSLTVGKEYSVLNIRIGVEVIDDAGSKYYWRANHFEPVLDSAENPLQEMKLTPELGAVEPKFKVGDKVYKYGETDVKTVLEVFNDGYMNLSNYPHRVNHESICHATQENYEMLCKPYPHIEFELPPKPLTGNDLTKGMFERGDFAVVCKCSDTSESSAITFSPLRLIVGYSNGRFEENNGKCWNYAVPFDPKTNLPLTEGVLNEKI